MIIPEEKPITAGGFYAEMSKPAFAMSNRPRRSCVQGLLFVPWLYVLCVHSYKCNWYQSLHFSSRPRETHSSEKLAHFRKKVFSSKLQSQQTASSLHNCMVFCMSSGVCLLFAALKTVLVRILRYACCCLSITVEREKIDLPSFLRSAKSSTSG